MALKHSTRTSSEGVLLARRRASVIFVLLGVVACTNFSGCVFRRMTIRSDPPGALVLLDGEEVGFTPYTADFTYYGTREITLIKPGYETLTTLQAVPTPFHQIPGIDFFADNLSPFKVTNRHEFTYKLQSQRIVPTQELLNRANHLRFESQSGP
jgi:hypothetical protein